MQRRDFLKFLGVSTYGLSLGQSAFLTSCLTQRPDLEKFLINGKDIKGLSPTNLDDLVLANGLSYHLIIKHGDKINQQDHFGFNNDYIDYVVLNDQEILMWVNNEYVHPLFIGGYERTKENIDKEKYEVGGSLIKLKKTQKGYVLVENDPLNQRITGATRIPFHPPQKILGNTYGLGTLGNCAGGKTPWGTILTCEENFQDYYGDRQEDGSIKHPKYSLHWDKFDFRPPEHYGWVVEVNPLTGEAKKHIHLGRFAHESATCIKAKNGHVVVYSGDDKKDEHLYKFVSKSGENFDEGTLYVADIGQGKWLELSLNNPKLKNMFKSHTDLMIRVREASKILGATELDRPEDIEIHPLTGDIFITLTNNKPKGNYHGSILKISEEDGDYSSLSFKSETFLTGGDFLSCPDNLTFDSQGNLYIATDISGSSMNKEPYTKFKNNGLFVVPTSGEFEGQAIQLASAPTDAELTGLKFSPHEESLFVSVQHPGENSETLKSLTSHWPFNDGQSIPRSAVIEMKGMS